MSRESESIPNPSEILTNSFDFIDEISISERDPVLPIPTKDTDTYNGRPA